MTTYRPSPRPTFDGPALIPYARRDAPHLGRPGGGRGRRLDLRLDRARPRARLRPRAGHLVPAFARVPHDLRRRRAALRAARDDGARESRDGRGAARAARRPRVLPQRHLAPRPRARQRGAARARALRAAARVRLLGRLRAHEAVPRAGRLALRRRRAARAPARSRARAAHAVRARRSSGGARSACSRASTRAPSTSPRACSS